MNRYKNIYRLKSNEIHFVNEALNLQIEAITSLEALCSFKSIPYEDPTWWMTGKQTNKPVMVCTFFSLPIHGSLVKNSTEIQKSFNFPAAHICSQSVKDIFTQLHAIIWPYSAQLYQNICRWSYLHRENSSCGWPRSKKLLDGFWSLTFNQQEIRVRLLKSYIPLRKTRNTFGYESSSPQSKLTSSTPRLLANLIIGPSSISVVMWVMRARFLTKPQA